MYPGPHSQQPLIYNYVSKLHIPVPIIIRKINCIKPLGTRNINMQYYNILTNLLIFKNRKNQEHKTE